MLLRSLSSPYFTVPRLSQLLSNIQNNSVRPLKPNDQWALRIKDLYALVFIQKVKMGTKWPFSEDHCWFWFFSLRVAGIFITVTHFHEELLERITRCCFKIMHWTMGCIRPQLILTSERGTGIPDFPSLPGILVHTRIGI